LCAALGSAETSSMVQPQAKDERPTYYFYGLATLSDGGCLLHTRPQRTASISKIHSRSSALSGYILGSEQLLFLAFLAY